MVNVQLELDKSKLEHVSRMLSEVPNKKDTVLRNAINRGLIAGRTQATKEARKRYDIKTGDLRANHNVKLRAEATGGELRFSGAKIPLYRFHPSPRTRQYTGRYVNGRSGWRITKAVSAADVRGDMRARPDAFIATFRSGHTGLFRRTGGSTSSGKDKIREYWGFALADMLDYPDARESIEERMMEITDRRIDSELYRILNGF